MQLFSNYTNNELDKLFYHKPQSFHKFSNRNLLSYALGATLYMPATKPNIAQNLLAKKHSGLSSMVIDLEDAVGDGQVEWAEELLGREFKTLLAGVTQGIIREDELPLIFIRIRNRGQLLRVLDQLQDSIYLLAGFVLPKFAPETGESLLADIKSISTIDNPLYAMPILETNQVMNKETRLSELLAIKDITDQYKDQILNIRIGATDFSGIFGIRRNPETTVYDISVVRDCITDIINIFLRRDSSYVISGPVWEYFSSKERLLKPQLRQTPFRERFGNEGLKYRAELIDDYMDGFLREIFMDITNGLIGKTIIHPSHIIPVQALNVVSYEEYADAMTIISEVSGEVGVMKSQFSNKMNEVKPHTYWAQKILFKSQIYGVLNEQYTYLDLLKKEVFI